MTHPPHLRQRLTAAATATGTLAITLALLAGMPYVLWRAAAIPWPQHVSSLDEFVQRLAQPVSDPLMIDLLAVVGWACWAAFTASVIRETIWYATRLPHLLRDRHAHHEHLAALPLRSSLAALCIGTLVVALLALWRPQPADAQQPLNQPRSHTAQAAPLIPAPARQPTAAAAAAAPTQLQDRPGPPRSTSPGQPTAVRHIEYTVIEGDTLWDIAHKYLGDGISWPRIYALNKDRAQSDGVRLTDPDLIRPGWQLTIPVTQTTTPPAPVPADPAPDTTPPQPTPSTQPTPHHHTDADGARTEAHPPAEASLPTKVTAAPKADTKPGPAAINLGQASLIGITAAAGLLAARRYWYWHQRRLHQPDQQTGLPEAPALSPLVDKAAQAAHAATQPRPPHDPDALVTRRTPSQQPHPSGTVTIGIREDTEVLLDELATPAGCAWTGAGAEDAARALLVGILTAAERQRPRAPHVTAIVPEDVADMLLPGLPAQFTALTQSPDLTQAIHAAEQHLVAHARAEDARDTAPSATGPSSTDPGPEADPGVLLLLAVPDAAHTGQLQALATRSHREALIVLTLGAALPGAAHWHIAPDGTTTAAPGTPGQKPSPLTLFHLTPEAGRDMTDVLLTAHGQRPRLRILPIPNQTPHSKHPDPPAEPSPDDDPTEPHPVKTSRPAQTKPVRLHVLGPITLYARGNPDPIGTNLRSEVHEFLALLAAHPTGLLTSDIADKLHLAPGSDQNALKNLRRAVRRALRAATGITAQEFILRQGELHKLHPDLVETDLTDFNRCLKEAFASSSTTEKQNTALPAVREALTHYRGPFAQGSDYLWADAIREHIATQATDAALRLARQAERADATPREQAETLALLEHLSTLHPDHERLAQHAIRLYQTAGRHDAARHTYTRLQRHLADLGLQPDPATQALITPRNQARKTR